MASIIVLLPGASAGIEIYPGPDQARVDQPGRVDMGMVGSISLLPRTVFIVVEHRVATAGHHRPNRHNLLFRTPVFSPQQMAVHECSCIAPQYGRPTHGIWCFQRPSRGTHISEFIVDGGSPVYCQGQRVCMPGLGHDRGGQRCRVPCRGLRTHGAPSESTLQLWHVAILVGRFIRTIQRTPRLGCAPVTRAIRFKLH